MYAKSGYAPLGGSELSDIKASDVVNDSGVPGGDVAEALDNLSSTMAGTPHRDRYDLTSAQIAMRAVYLSNTPKAGAPVEVRIISAGVNLEDSDFEITGSTLSWAGFPPDGILEEGDILVVIYYI